MPTLQGNLDGSRLKVALVVSRFNGFVTSRLLAGAEACLEQHGCTADRRTVVRVPGAWEIPQAAQRLARAGGFDAIVGLGALIRGDTAHFDYIAGQVARGLTQIGLDSGIPVVFGVPTTENPEQAVERSGAKTGNKGWEAALAALEMADLYLQIDRPSA